MQMLNRQIKHKSRREVANQNYLMNVILSEAKKLRSFWTSPV